MFCHGRWVAGLAKLLVFQLPPFVGLHPRQIFKKLFPCLDTRARAREQEQERERESEREREKMRNTDKTTRCCHRLPEAAFSAMWSRSSNAMLDRREGQPAGVGKGLKYPLEPGVLGVVALSGFQHIPERLCKNGWFRGWASRGLVRGTCSSCRSFHCTRVRMRQASLVAKLSGILGQDFPG